MSLEQVSGALVRAKANVGTSNIYYDATLPFSGTYITYTYASSVLQPSAIKLFRLLLPSCGTLNVMSAPSLAVSGNA